MSDCDSCGLGGAVESCLRCDSSLCDECSVEVADGFFCRCCAEEKGIQVDE